MPTPLEQWFLNLRSIQACVKNLDHRTSDDLLRFSHQTLGELIGPTTTGEGKLRQGTLCTHCQNVGIGSCPSDSFSNLTKDFRWFLDNFGGLVVERLLRRSLEVAQTLPEHPYPGNTIRDFRVRRLGDVFGTADDRQALDQALSARVPPDFYRETVRATTSGSEALTMDAFCQRIMA